MASNGVEWRRMARNGAANLVRLHEEGYSMPARRTDTPTHRRDAWVRISYLLGMLYPGQTSADLGKLKGVGSDAMGKIRNGKTVGPGKFIPLAVYLCVHPYQIDPQRHEHWDLDLESLGQSAKERK